MTVKVFLDSNLWVYLFSEEREKREVASQLLSDNFLDIRISAQVLGELFNVLTKKKITSTGDARQIVDRISDEFPVIVIDKALVKQAIEMKIKLQFSYWDSLIIAAALKAECSILYSEDLQHNQVIEKKLTVINPFLF